MKHRRELNYNGNGKLQPNQSLTGLTEALQGDQQKKKLTTQNRENMLEHETLYWGTAIKSVISQLKYIT